MVGHLDCIAYSSLHVVYVSTKHIAYFLSSFFCLFSLFPYLYVGVPWPWADCYRWAHLKISRRHRLLRAFLLFIYAFMSFPFHVVLWHLYVKFLWTCVFTLCFDNGGVHNLLVGSEPIHCDCYLYVCIYRFQTYLSYPWWGWTLILSYWCLFLSYPWWGDTLWFILLSLLLLFCYSRA